MSAPVAALANRPQKRHLAPRKLSEKEMRRIHGAAYVPAPGSGYRWQTVLPGGINTTNGNKLTAVPIVGWKARGGKLAVNLTLFHNSESSYNGELGQHWTHSYDLFGTVDGSGNFTMNWGDGRQDVYTLNIDGSFSPPTGVHDTLVYASGHYTLTTHWQTIYHFNTSLFCDTITDLNGNEIDLAYNGSNQVTTITDTTPSAHSAGGTNRVITLSYSSGRVSSISDPLSRTWSLAYATSGSNTTLTSVSLPALGETTYSYAFTYDAYNDLASLTTPNSNTTTFTYDASVSPPTLASITDPCGNETTYLMDFDVSMPELGSAMQVTDPNGNQTIYGFSETGSFQLDADPESYGEVSVFDSEYNVIAFLDKNGNYWYYAYDANGNLSGSEDPLTNIRYYRYNSLNEVTAAVIPTGEATVYSYDSAGNLTGTASYGVGGTVYTDDLGGSFTITYSPPSGDPQASTTSTPNAFGETTDYYDANGHHYQYAYDAYGNLDEVTTPLGNSTYFVSDVLGFRTSRTDAMSRETDYTPDAWERLVTITYPDSSTKTYQYDPDNNLTQFTDGTGTTYRTYDADDRILTEKLGTVTTATYLYDQTGQLGLLSSLTDSNGRTISYGYTVRNELYTVTETVGGTAQTTTYSYDPNGNETGVVNANGTVVTNTYDTANNLTETLTANSSGTTLSSFSYTPDADNRRHIVDELDGSEVTYGYDWGSRLTSEVRTGTNPYSNAYTLDKVGNRTQLVGAATTINYSLDDDDELTSSVQTYSGSLTELAMSYSYNANGEQTGRSDGTISTSFAFDYDGQLTSITQGSNTTSFTYDGLGRRRSRTAGGTTTNFQFDDDDIILEKQGSSTTATYTLGNEIIRKDGEYPITDGLGSQRAVANSSQSVTATQNFDAFGNSLGTTGSSSDPYKYAANSGYRNDGDAGLTLVGARYYDSQVGRFATRDTDLSQAPYLYCDHDPVNNLDPSGHQAAAAAAATDFVLGGPENPVADGAAVIVLIGYGLWTLYHPSKNTVGPGGMPRSPKGNKPLRPDPGPKPNPPGWHPPMRGGPIRPLPPNTQDELYRLMLHLLAQNMHSGS